MISQFVYPMNQFGNLGKIHSKFDRSFNILINNQLIHIGSYEQYISSFGIYIDFEIYNKLQTHIQIDNVVKMNKKEFTVYSNKGIYKVDLSDSEIISLRVNSVKWDRKTIQNLTNILNEKNFDKLVGLPQTEETQKVFKDLMFKRTEEIDWQSTIKYLIGRGKGLTPSGDDILVAYLYVMKMFDSNRAESLSTALLDQNLSTTDVSNAYLKACIAGYVSSPNYSFYQAIKDKKSSNILQQKIENIMYIGHTSGKDMTFGIKLGINYINNQLIN